MIKLSSIVFSFTITVCMSNIAYAADNIPKQFHGRWGDRHTCAGTGELPIEITGLRYAPYEMGCDLKKVIKSSDNLFIGQFLCSSEGEEVSQKHTLELKDGKLYADGRGPIPKCK